MKYVQFSEKGPRLNNEDCCRVVEIAGKRTLFIVCDGMGGHVDGEVASEVVCDTFSDYWTENHDVADSAEKIHDAAGQAGKALDEKSCHGPMGTTLVMASVEGATALIAHAGDSRCYVIDIKGNVKYRTIDHEEQGLITNAFFTGYSRSVVPEVKTVALEPLDRILLCTDGLYKAIDDDVLLHTLQCAKDVNQVAEKYLHLCEGAASDNYTAIVIEFP